MLYLAICCVCVCARARVHAGVYTVCMCLYTVCVCTCAYMYACVYTVCVFVYSVGVCVGVNLDKIMFLYNDNFSLLKWILHHPSMLMPQNPSLLCHA